MRISRTSASIAGRTTRGFVAAAGVATLALSVTVAGAVPAKAAGSPRTGLFGTQDPTYDGVYRQSLSLLALKAAGVTPDAAAINWLVAQQCADGSFTSFRDDVSIPCENKDKDSNATALATQALHLLDGKASVASAAAAALPSFQLTGGGFYSNQAFGPPAADSNSTGLVLSALAAMGTDAANVQQGGKSGVDFLRELQLGCDAVEGERGAFDFMPQTPLTANDFATVQAALGMAGAYLPVEPRDGDGTVSAFSCPSSGPQTASESARVAGRYLANRIVSNGGTIPSSFGPGADITSTANAVLLFVATGEATDQVGPTLDALEKATASYVKASDGVDLPGSLATLILAAHAGGRNPHAFGGTDLVARLVATQTQAETPTPTTPATPSPELPFTGAPVLVMASVALAAVGTGVLLVGASRRRNDQRV